MSHCGPVPDLWSLPFDTQASPPPPPTAPTPLIIPRGHRGRPPWPLLHMKGNVFQTTPMASSIPVLFGRALPRGDFFNEIVRLVIVPPPIVSKIRHLPDQFQLLGTSHRICVYLLFWSISRPSDALFGLHTSFLRHRFSVLFFPFFSFFLSFLLFVPH